jgi:hypothetical protein
MADHAAVVLPTVLLIQRAAIGLTSPDRAQRREPKA